VSPADSFATAIGVGIGIGIGIELTNLISVQLLADRLATLSALREHGHTTSEQGVLLAGVVCAEGRADGQAGAGAARAAAARRGRGERAGDVPGNFRDPNDNAV
jgi:hypothetical protein